MPDRISDSLYSGSLKRKTKPTNVAARDLQDLLDPSIVSRAMIAPWGRDAQGVGQWAVPGIVAGAMKALDQTGEAMRLPHGTSPDHPAYKGVFDVAGAINMPALLRKGATSTLGMNLYHGGPNKWAAEPGFPQGRPRLDKMGEGSGGSYMGEGFYATQNPTFANAYKDKVADGYLYKVDIPDEDIAKYLDWDKSLVEQSDKVKEIIEKLRSDNYDLFQVTSAEGGKLLPDLSGSDFYHILSDILGSDRAASKALAEAGIPGNKIPEINQQTWGEPKKAPTHTYVTWDQKVLDRAKVLQRNEEIYNKSNIETTKRGNVLEINKIETPKDFQGKGLADLELQKLIEQADADGITLALTPSNAFGANKTRLVKWYKRNGFVPNKGRNKDFTTRESMIRYPVTKRNEEIYKQLEKSGVPFA